MYEITSADAALLDGSTAVGKKLADGFRISFDGADGWTELGEFDSLHDALDAFTAQLEPYGLTVRDMRLAAATHIIEVGAL